MIRKRPISIIRMKGLMTVLLIAAVTICFVLQTGTPVYSAGEAPSMNLGANTLAQNVNKKNAQTVWYADKAWDVIGYNDGGVAGMSGAVTLLAAGNLAESRFDTNNSNVYARSILRKMIEGYDTEGGSHVNGVIDDFSLQEQRAVIKRTLKKGSYNMKKTDCVAGEEVPDALLWPLSTKEAYSLAEGLRKEIVWWLRSPGRDNNRAAVVFKGLVTEYGTPVNLVDTVYGVRPAFYLDLDSIIFTTAADGGKSSGPEGPDALISQYDQTNDNDEWKVTLGDEAHKDFAVYGFSNSEKVLTVNYTGASTGDNEYISAFITDKPITEADAKITYYGRIKKCASDSDASGTVTINVAGKLRKNNRIYVINEQYRRNRKTDYSSTCKDVTPEPVLYTVTFEVVNGSWSEGEGNAATEDRIVELDGFEGDTLKLTENDIPEVGDRPNDHYRVGRWDAALNTDTVITEDKTYTYTYSFLHHNYKFKGWTWTGNETVGYTKATALYECDIENCGKTQQYVAVPTANEIPATCTEGGETRYTARVSKTEAYDGVYRSETKIAKFTDPIGHDYQADEKSARPATCETAGKEADLVCIHEGCSAVIGGAAIQATGHEWGEWYETTPPTEQEEGVEKRVCTNDPSHTETRRTKTLPHTHQLRHVLAEAATCTEAGNTGYWICDQGDSSCGRYFSDAAGTTEIDRDETIIYPTGHTAGEGKRENVIPSTCTMAGTFDEVVHCTVCNDIIRTDHYATPKLDHVAGEPEITNIVPATCTQDGSYDEIVKCEVCGTEVSHKTVIIHAGHDPSAEEEYLLVTEPTCTQSGTQMIMIKCAVCNTVLHGPVSKRIPALGHDWGKTTYVWAKDNSIVAARRECKREGCDASDTETAAVTSEVTKPATCAEKGDTTYKATFRNKAFVTQTKVLENVEALGHDWGEWTITKPVTENEAGEKTRTCKRDPKHVETEVIPAEGYAPGSDPDRKGRDGTAVGPGASAAAAEKAITTMNSDTDPEGAVFSKLKLKSLKQTKTSITLKWTRTGKAVKYVIYGNKCGKTTKPKKLAEVTGSTKKITKVAGKKVKKGTYYKFIIVALDKNNNVVSTSKLIHAATKGGKVGNDKKVTVRKTVIAKAKKLRKGKTLKLNAKAVAQSKTKAVRRHVKVRYESTNKKIAAVNEKGVVKAKKKGTCYVYAYAQNGISKKIKVNVK